MAGKIRNLTIYVIITYMIAALFFVPVLAAQEPVFRLDIDSLNLQTGISTNIVISLVNAQGAEVLNIEGLENFEVLSQSQSTVTSIINGETTYQEDLYYTIMPKTAGQFTLKANVQYNGQSYETNALQVTVSESSVNTNETVQDLFVKTIISHTEAYSGEKIVLTYELYSRYSIDSYGFTSNVAIDGVVAKDMPENQLKSESVYLNGERYAMYEVKQLIIDPIKSGVYIIPSFNFQVNVITNGRGGGFGGFFRSSTPMYLQTEEKELTVKPLPSEGKTNDFSGIVGELQLESNYSREEMNYGDSFALYITASGNCNLDGLKNNIVGSIPGFSVYETHKNTIESVENNQYHVEKAFEAVLVPEKNGVLDVEPVFISYFNPVTEKYEKAEIPGVTINILGEMPQPNAVQSAAVESVMINQVRYTDETDDYFTIQMKKDTVYRILIGAVILIILGAVLIWFVLNRRKQDSTLKSLYRQLTGAKNINEIYNLFNDMIKHCYKISLKASPRNIIRTSLPDEDLAFQVTEVMDYMESSRANEQNSHNDLKNKIKGIYRKIKLK